MQYRLGRLDDSAATYERAISLRPDFGCEFKLAVIAALKEDYDAAFRWIDSLMEHAPNDLRNADGHVLRAIILHVSGRHDDARAELRAGRALTAKVGTAFHVDRLEGWLDYDIGRWADSRRMFQKSCAGWEKQAGAAPARNPCMTAMALVDVAEGKSSAAQASLQRLVPQPATAGATPGALD